MEICYVCNRQSTDWRRNFTEVKSQHTQAPVSQFIRKFLGDFKSFRNIDSESNCICRECLQKIDDYDWSCQHAIDQEVKLRDLLWTTEAKLIDSSDALYGSDVDTANDQNELDFGDDPFDSGGCDDDGPDVETMKPIPKPTVLNSMQKSKNESIPKPSIEKSVVKIRLMPRSTTTKSIGPLSLKNVPVGTLLKTKDGKVFRLKAKPLQSTTAITHTKGAAAPEIKSVAMKISVCAPSLPASSGASYLKTVGETSTTPSKGPINMENIVIKASKTPVAATTPNPIQCPETPPKVRAWIRKLPQYDCDVCGKIFKIRGRFQVSDLQNNLKY